MIILAVCHPPVDPNIPQGFYGWDAVHNVELFNLSKSILKYDIPVIIEHKWDKFVQNNHIPIGRVYSTGILRGGMLGVAFYVYDSPTNTFAQEAIEGILNQKYKQVSLSLAAPPEDTVFNEEGRPVRLNRVFPYELSICEQGQRQGTRFLFYVYRDCIVVFDQNSRISRIIRYQLNPNLTIVENEIAAMDKFMEEITKRGYSPEQMGEFFARYDENENSKKRAAAEHEQQVKKYFQDSVNTFASVYLPEVDNKAIENELKFIEENALNMEHFLRCMGSYGVEKSTSYQELKAQMEKDHAEMQSKLNKLEQEKLELSARLDERKQVTPPANANNTSSSSSTSAFWEKRNAILAKNTQPKSGSTGAASEKPSVVVKHFNVEPAGIGSRPLNPPPQ